MPTGASQPFYLQDQPSPPFNLELNNSYFLVKLHDAQAFFQANFLGRADLVTFSSSVTSSLQPNSPTQSLHQISTIQRNTPCHLGLSTNLTEWLPASPSDSSLGINIKYTVLQGKPIQKFVDHIKQADLVAKLSLRPDWAVAVKVTDIVGRLLSYLAQEGSQQNLFTLVMDFNVAELKTGYHLVYGSHSDEDWPSPQFLQIDADKRLRDKTSGSLLSRLSYAVIQVLGIPRFGQEKFRDEPWWLLLKTVKENILDSVITTELERRQKIGEWLFVLRRVKESALKRGEFLLSEIEEIIAAAQVEVETKLHPGSTAEAAGLGDELPDDLQEILGVETEGELQKLVRDYQDALDISQQLLEQYKLLGD
ncbi:hypothetical protein [Nostoc sp.]|uniref:hypothetical protein n=1 Tax=Nostoc sp. TaxID=1180 RepID=UPI002FFB56AC